MLLIWSSDCNMAICTNSYHTSIHLFQFRKAGAKWVPFINFQTAERLSMERRIVYFPINCLDVTFTNLIAFSTPGYFFKNTNHWNMRELIIHRHTLTSVGTVFCACIIFNNNHLCIFLSHVGFRTYLSNFSNTTDEDVKKFFLYFKTEDPGSNPGVWHCPFSNPRRYKTP